MMKSIQDELIQFMSRFPRTMIAFSGGVDSSLVLALAVKALGASNVLAVTSDGPSLPSRDRLSCLSQASALGVRILLVNAGESQDPRYVRNHSDRCYHCKSHLYAKMASLPEHAEYPTIMNGTNSDDFNDYRPGLKAAAEAGIVSPLVECEIDKDMARLLALRLGLSCWNKPASPCLASRFPYYTPVSAKVLGQVDEAETFLLESGFSQVRVRYRNEVAHIEVPCEELDRFRSSAYSAMVRQAMTLIGFKSYCIDPEGFVSGKLNRELKEASLFRAELTRTIAYEEV